MGKLATGGQTGARGGRKRPASRVKRWSRFGQVVESDNLVFVDLSTDPDAGLATIYATRSQAPTSIIVATGREEVSLPVAALEEGADLYLPSNLSDKHVEAQLAAIARRDKDDIPGDRQLGPLELISSRRQALVDGKPIELTPHEYRALSRLMENCGQLTTFAALATALTGSTSLNGSMRNSVKVAVNRLRSKLIRMGLQQPSIRTIRGSGYLLA